MFSALLSGVHEPPKPLASCAPAWYYNISYSHPFSIHVALKLLLLSCQCMGLMTEIRQLPVSLTQNVLVVTTLNFGSTYAFECDSVFNNFFGAITSSGI